MGNSVNTGGTAEEIQAANKELIEMGLDPVQDPSDIEYVMSEGKNPYPLLIMENICRLLESDSAWSGRFRYNEFSHMTEVKEDGGVWTDMQDYHVSDIRRYISSTFSPFAKISKDMVIDAMTSVARQSVINPPRDYLMGVTWDKKKRLDTWLNKAYGAPKDKLYAAIGANWMKGLVKRVLHPGCQFDEVLVLESGQGMRKSSSLRALGSPWHVETTYSNDKDFFLVLAKNTIVEFSEGDILSRAGVRAVKALITKTEDQYRLPYGRAVETLKRGCVFAMTTNDTDYLKDETGNRRWLPVRLEKEADVDWIIENRDQLYAEAVYRVEVLKETTWEYPKEELEALQESRTVQETHMEEIEEWYLTLPIKRREEGITIKEAWMGAIVDATDKVSTINNSLEWEIGRSLRKMHLESRSVKRGDKVVRRWVFTDKTILKYQKQWESEIVNTEIF